MRIFDVFTFMICCVKPVMKLVMLHVPRIEFIVGTLLPYYTNYVTIVHYSLACQQKLHMKVDKTYF